MARIEKTVFISYRRTNLPWALCIYQNLTQHGYDVFFDYQSIDSGSFETAILDNIRARAHFVLILTPSALERCKNPNDWLRREIETALDEKRNIVPLMFEGFDFGSPHIQEVLTGKLSAISDINALPIHNAYVFEGLERLRIRFLNVALEDVNFPTLLSEEVREVTKTEQTVANEAEPVTEEQLTAQTLFERGYVFHENKNFEEALRCYSEALRLDPKFDSAYYYNLGLLLKDLKRHDEAEVAFRKVIELNPSNDNAYIGLGIFLHEDLNRHEEAEANYRKAIKLNPSNDSAYFLLGDLLENLNRYEEAETNYRKTIELNPSYNKAYYKLGILLKNLNRYEEAETAFRKVIELNPSFDVAQVNLGQMYFEQGKTDEAIKFLTEALRLNPNSSRCYRQRGFVYQTTGNFESALNDYKQAINLQPDYGLVAMSLFGLLKKLGRNDEAKDYETLAREFAKNESEYNRACFESLCGNIDEAINLLKIAFENGQSSKEWAQQDPDLELLRNDPRFIQIVGEKP